MKHHLLQKQAQIHIMELKGAAGDLGFPQEAFSPAALQSSFLKKTRHPSLLEKSPSDQRSRFMRRLFLFNPFVSKPWLRHCDVVSFIHGRAFHTGLEDAFPLEVEVQGRFFLESLIKTGSWGGKKKSNRRISACYKDRTIMGGLEAQEAIFPPHPTHSRRRQGEGKKERRDRGRLL